MKKILYGTVFCDTSLVTAYGVRGKTIMSCTYEICKWTTKKNNH